MLWRLLPVIVQIKLLTNGLCLGGERPAVRQAHRHPSIIYMKFQSSLPGTRSSEQTEFSLLFFPYKPHLFILFSNNKKFALNYHCRSKEKERKKEDSDLAHIQSQPTTFFLWTLIFEDDTRLWKSFFTGLLHSRVTTKDNTVWKHDGRYQNYINRIKRKVQTWVEIVE